MIESMGVPHTEVDLILLNGAPVDFFYLVRDGDPNLRDLCDVATVILDTGIRVGELRRLRWVNVDFGRRLLILPMQMSHQIHTEPRGPESLRILESRHERNPAAVHVLGRSPQVFFRRIKRQLRALCNQIGAGHLPLHALCLAFPNRDYNS
jgi:integrase